MLFQNFLNNEGLLRDERPRSQQDSNGGEIETPSSGFTANSHISFIWKMCEDPSSLGLFNFTNIKEKTGYDLWYDLWYGKN